MDGFFEDIGRGFFRGIGYILAEIFFRTICYWVGWPICRLVTLGKYPSASKVIYLDDHRSRADGTWCAVVGLLALIVLALYLLGQFSYKA
ncbi:MAG TPA: hypothetical protein DD644_09990 [Halomonas sp.]|nr:hypothetical protein [Halomonas sp.]